MRVLQVSLRKMTQVIFTTKNAGVKSSTTFLEAYLEILLKALEIYIPYDTPILCPKEFILRK